MIVTRRRTAPTRKRCALDSDMVGPKRSIGSLREPVSQTLTLRIAHITLRAPSMGSRSVGLGSVLRPHGPGIARLLGGAVGVGADQAVPLGLL